MGVVAVARWKFGAWRVVVEGTGAAFTSRKAESIAGLVHLNPDAAHHADALGVPQAGHGDPEQGVVVRFEFPAAVARHVDLAKELRASGQHAAADRELGHAVLKLRSKRMPPEDIAVCLGISAHTALREANHGGGF